jgi:hypothetical protein
LRLYLPGKLIRDAVGAVFHLEMAHILLHGGFPAKAGPAAVGQPR